MSRSAEAVVKRPAQEVFKFRLYVAADAVNSMQAIANLMRFCREHLHDRYEIEIVDVFREPRRALAEGVLMTPTLIKLAPAPVKRIVGTLSDESTLSQTFGLQVPA